MPSRISLLSYLCQGRAIPYDDLFKYTTGQFLVNEQYELAKRYVKFDATALCALVSSLPCISSPISHIDKLEGGFNKTLLMTAENGKEVLVKIPFPNLVPSGYSTASEVAVLTYGRPTKLRVGPPYSANGPLK